MSNYTRFVIVLASLACVHCGDSGGSTSSSDVDSGMPGSPSDGNGSGSTKPDAGPTDMDTDPVTGGDGEPDAGMAPDDAITGTEPECVAAFTRVAECYFGREACVDGAVDNAKIVGPALARTNCATFAMQAGGLEAIAATFNAQTACDDTNVTGLFASLDGNQQIKELCEAAALTTEECTASCVNVVPCAAGLSDPMAAAALGDKANCESNCTMQAVLSPVFRCALMAGTECTAVAACFGP